MARNHTIHSEDCHGALLLVPHGRYGGLEAQDLLCGLGERASRERVGGVLGLERQRGAIAQVVALAGGSKADTRAIQLGRVRGEVNFERNRVRPGENLVLPQHRRHCSPVVCATGGKAGDGNKKTRIHSKVRIQFQMPHKLQALTNFAGNRMYAVSTACMHPE